MANKLNLQIGERVRLTNDPEITGVLTEIRWKGIIGLMARDVCPWISEPVILANLERIPEKESS